MTRDINGYSADIPYLRDFKPMLSPAWLDHVALAAGVEPPPRQSGFTWCDLGCGQGVTAVILAATHPSGVFHGIDAMPMHIDHARRLAADAAVENVFFHAIDFAGALELEPSQFDYIVAHGVYTWIDLESQGALRRFIDRHLKPGGLVYLGYNAMPGWARDLPFQGLVRELGRTFPGDNAQRFAAAAGIAAALAEAGVPALATSFTVAELKQRPEDYAPAYLVHEFMPAAWRPLFVTEVREAMRRIGLVPVGSATLAENFDWMVLDERARKIVDAIADEDARELVRDFYLDQRFRRDVFGRSNPRLASDDGAARLVSSTFALARPASAVRYTTTTPLGPNCHDTAAARAIIAALALGARSLGGLAQKPPSPEYLKAILALCAGGDVMPVEPATTSVGHLNQVLCRRVDGPEEIRWLALPHGSAIEADPALMRRLRDGEEIGEKEFPGWHGFLAQHGVLSQ
jgi:SAM-dependent methyltransferase